MTQDDNKAVEEKLPQTLKDELKDMAKKLQEGGLTEQEAAKQANKNISDKKSEQSNSH